MKRWQGTLFRTEQIFISIIYNLWSSYHITREKTPKFLYMLIIGTIIFIFRRGKEIPTYQVYFSFGGFHFAAIGSNYLILYM